MSMLSSPRRAAAAALLALLAFAPGAVPAQTQPATPPQLEPREKHGDWEVICGRATPEATEECFMAQGVNAQETGQTVLAAMVMKPANREPVLRLTVPLGVLLPRGLAFKIDTSEVGGVGFLYCLAEGCVTQVTLTSEVVNRLKAGNKATATVHRLNDQSVDMPLSLTGFTAAYEAF